MRRRVFIGGVGAAAVLGARGAWAQPSRPVIGFLGSTTPSAASHQLSAFARRLNELGWTRNLVIEDRWAEGRPERAAEIVAEFVKLKVNVIVTAGGTPSAI